MAGCEKTASVWCLPSVREKDESDHVADTFLTKVKRFFISGGGGSCKDKGSRRTTDKTSYQFSCCFYVLLFIFIFSSSGCILMWFTEIYLDSILNQMTLKNDTEIFKAWKNPPVKPLICVHIFNYTNLEDYLNGNSKKIVVNDTGPYCYRETLEKTDIKFYDNGTVSYGDRRTHVFEEKNSTGTKDDLLVVPNLPKISAVAKISTFNMITRWALKNPLKLYGGKTMIKLSADEFLFGYTDKLITWAKIFDKEGIPFEKFGVLALRATETKDRLTVRTGSGDLNGIGVVTAVNGEDMLSAWDDEECNRVDGSDGAFFPRHGINETARLFLFHKDLCRKLPLVYQKEVDFQDGVMGMRFHTPPDVYNVTDTCFCKGDQCPLPGVFDVSPCAKDAPMLTSFPHFMNADSSITEPFEGLHPDPKKHDFYIDINPILGFTLGTVSRIQLNVQIRNPHSDYDEVISEFPDGLILPVVWLEVTADRLPPDLFKMIYHASVTVPLIQWSLQWGFLIITIISGLCLLRYLLSCKQSAANIPSTSEKKAKEVIIYKVTSL